MKYWVVSFVLFFCTLQTFGQQEYFVYLQTESNQPFYVRVDKAVYSSSASGYLILPRINDNAPLSITIGFPKNIFPEQIFNIPAAKKDAGYLVKDFAEKGWGLYNLQTLAMLMNNNPPDTKKNTELSGVKKTDDFSLLLSHAVNDTAVLYSVVKPPKIVNPAPVAVVEEKKDTSLVIQKPDTLAVTKPIIHNDSNLMVTTPVPEKKATVLPAADSVVKKTMVDSSAIAKTSLPVAQPQNTVAKDSPVVKVKQPAKPGRGDSITIINGKGTDTVAKNKERKDTIIMMSGKTSDTQKTVAKNTKSTREDSITLLPSKDEPVKNKIVKAADTVAQPTAKKEIVVDAPVKKQPAHVSKVAEFRTDTSYVAIFIDGNDDEADTIRISVPFREPEEVVVKKEDSKPATIASKPADTVVANKEQKDSAAIAKANNDTAKQTTTPVQQPPVTPVKKDSAFAITNAPKANKPVMTNSDCKDEATDADIDKLRVKMLLVNSDEDHIALARRLFKLKCFSVKQVKALTEFFKTDEGRYKWFDAVYPFVSDSSNFSSLSELLKNDYYLSRFKAMLRN